MDIIGGNVKDRDIVHEMRESYLNYAMSVIVSRALPDVRDGLKPVHRRVLYGTSELGASWNRAYKKCARIVGEVMGKYHPHGDSSVYDALVRMAQPWSLRYPLMDGQGNFGSIDGDSAAAMRYTEARMSRMSSEMLRDIEKDTVDWAANFDDTLNEPKVLPTVIPNLLMNGADGIAVGMATKIPPQNLNEIIEGLKALIDNPDLTIDELIENYIKGPDFPTGAMILGTDGINDAYKTGRGRVIMRARASIEETKTGRERIIVHELPYQVNKANQIEKIADLVREKKLEGISDLRDESDKDGIRIVVECKKDAIASVVLNNLFKHTQLQDTFGVNMLALVDGAPRLLNLKEALVHFLNFRRDVIIKRTRFELKEAEDRAHILEGLKIALDNIDEVIAIIRASKDPESAKIGLIERFEFSERQAKAILEMRLHRLTSLEVDKVVAEYRELLMLIEQLKFILENYGKQSDIMKQEFNDVAERYRQKRRTEIVGAAGDFSVEDMIANEDMVITITHNGFIKRTASSGWKRQRRGGRGMQGAKAKGDDFVEHLFVESTHNHMLFFTDSGRCYWLKVHEIPEAGRASRGRAIVNLIGCSTDEKVSAFVSVKDFSDENYVVMATRNGLVKRTNLSKYSRPRKGGIFAIEIKDGDELIESKITTGDEDIILGTRNGKSIRFNENNIRPTGRKTMGVKGITLSSKDDHVIGMIAVKREGTILAATDKGFGKRTSILEYRVQNRGGKGIITLKTSEKVGKLVAMLEVVNSDDLMIITDFGVMIRQSVQAIRVIGRNTQGVHLLRLDEGSIISSITRVMEKDDDKDEAEETDQDAE
ncbi:MAG: DNA gyrase subunit A [Candidatus Marinimicrobia bacterium]|nr:DNA gyrase subunit A [Candidatus Neomarinimicrobiota bacterium]